MADLRQNLIELAERAGRIALSHYGRVSADLKEDESPVSRADREVEDFLQQELGLLDPGAVFVGEEMTKEAGLVAAARAAERVWVVDPIDGTAAFLGEIDTFSVCIAQLREGLPFAGVVHLPALDCCYSAVAGQGALWRNPRGEQTLDASSSGSRHSSETCLLVSSNAHRAFSRIDYPGKIRSMGSTAFHFVLVARGVGVGAVSASSHIWDYAAAAAVLLEAGGSMRLLDGSEIDWRELMDGARTRVPVLGAHPDRWEELAGQIAFPSLG